MSIEENGHTNGEMEEVSAQADAPSGASFDDLARGLASGTVSRRGALRLLAGALFGGALASVPGVGRIAGESGEAQAQAATCANGGQSCTAQKCCKGFTCLVDQTSGTEKFCCPTTQVCGQTCCPTGGVCVNRQCICNNGTTRCIDPNDLFDIGACRNLQSDSKNCGACFNACNTLAGEACCSGVCKNLLEDEQNCGACGNSCGPNATCIAGVCCPNTRICGNTCLDTACDPAQCERCDLTKGACVSNCTAQETCIAGACQAACTPPQTPCNGQCVNLTTDANNCGACGTECPNGQGCCNGVCSALDTTTNCGTCGSACKPGEICCTRGGTNQCKLPTGATCSGGGNCCSGVCNKPPRAATGTCT